MTKKQPSIRITSKGTYPYRIQIIKDLGKDLTDYCNIKLGQVKWARYDKSLKVFAQDKQATYGEYLLKYGEYKILR